MNSKAWYLSSKIWIAIIGVIAGVSASLSGVEVLTIPGIVGAVLSGLVAVLRIIEGRDVDSAEPELTLGSQKGGAGIGALLIALVVGAVLLTSCAGGGLREDAKPWVAPVVSMCVPACDAAKVEADAAILLIDGDLGRIVAHIAAEQAYQWCRFGCIMAEHAVEPDGN